MMEYGIMMSLSLFLDGTRMTYFSITVETGIAGAGLGAVFLGFIFCSQLVDYLLLVGLAAEPLPPPCKKPLTLLLNSHGECSSCLLIYQLMALAWGRKNPSLRATASFPSTASQDSTCLTIFWPLLPWISLR